MYCSTCTAADGVLLQHVVCNASAAVASAAVACAGNWLLPTMMLLWCSSWLRATSKSILGGELQLPINLLAVDE
jgi:hypothetical protein